MSRRIAAESLSNIDVNELNRLGAFVRPLESPFLGLRTSRNLIEYHPAKELRDAPPQRIPLE